MGSTAEKKVTIILAAGASYAVQRASCAQEEWVRLKNMYVSCGSNEAVICWILYGS